LSRRLEILRLRSEIIKNIRSFFYDRGFTEVETPCLINAPAPEPYIETFRVSVKDKKNLFLIPSPELHMKRLLAEGIDKIFQICHVFRKEERGRFHLPEFTMLEWYRADSDYYDLMSDCEKLFQKTARAAGFTGEKIMCHGQEVDVSLPFLRITVEEAFQKYAGWKPGANPDPEQFNHDMAIKVEPSLPRERPVFLMDYPSSFASLARLKNGDKKISERVELYACGVEIANGFSELVDQEEQERRFREDAEKRKETGLQEYPMPMEFLSCLMTIPQCAGMSMGIDRLLMILSNAKEIDEVVSFVED
jgi:lysyl-tRNA synthetase class 2